MISEWNTKALRRTKLCAVAVMLLTFVGFGGWTALASISGAIVTEGVFKVVSNRKAVQHNEGGIVEDILVKDGDRVNAGQIVLRLDATRAKNSHGLLTSRRGHVRATIARLEAEIEGRAEIDFSSLDPAVVAEKTALLATQRELLSSRLQMLASSKAMSQERVAQLQQEVEGLTLKVEEQGFQITSLQDEIKDLEGLAEKGLTPRARLLEMQRDAANLRGQRAEANARIGAARQSMAEVRQQLAKLKAEFLERANRELTESQRQLSEVAEQLESATHVLAHADIRAPVTGIVVGLAVHTEGGVVAPGELLMEIVPEAEQLLVEMPIEVADIDAVHEGQTVDVQLVSGKARNLNKLEGVVSYVSADALFDETSGSAYFQARTKLSGDIPSEAAEIIQPGLSATVYIITEPRTPLSYLVAPLKDSISRAWREY